MKKTAANRHLLPLLVSVYNQSIQTYHHFPDVILCGRQRLETEAFAQLIAENFIVAYKADSFGRFYRLSGKGEAFLLQAVYRRRARQPSWFPAAQRRFAFAEENGC